VIVASFKFVNLPGATEENQGNFQLDYPFSSRVRTQFQFCYAPVTKAHY
jgi:hypothetical protein